MDNTFFNRPIMARTQILVHRGGGGQNKDFSAVWQANRFNQSLVSSIAQTTASKLDTTYSTDFQLSAVIPKSN